MTESPQTVVTRFAPSPTGRFHVGGIRSALYNYLFARKHGGTFILRSEDTDPVRSKKEFEDYFIEVFAWLGLEYDQFYRQSERTDIYKRYLERLIAEDKAYISKEEPKKEGDRAEVIRFRNPNTRVTFHDEVLGDISFDTTELGDFVIARDLESPIYHFTVVVDDFEMGVTHVIRGQEHVSNTPRQILIQEAIGAPRPVYAHASVILNEERAKLSKRDPTVRPTLEYRDEGYLPSALLNFMALLGWNPGTTQEIFTIDELIHEFSLERMQKPGAIFKSDKLEWVNREHVKRLPEEEQHSFLRKALPESFVTSPGFSEDLFHRIAPVILERITHFGEVRAMIDSGELSYYTTRPLFTKEALFWKDERDEQALTERLLHVRAILLDLPEQAYTPQELKNALWTYAEEKGRGAVLWPLRFALSGKERSPDPFQLATILGKEETIARIDGALSLFHEAP